MLSNFKKTENDPQKPPAPPAAGQPQPPQQQTAPPTQNTITTPSAPRPGDRSAPSVIGKDLAITGNLSSKGQLQIDGEVQGDIVGTHVIIGESARITGGISADEVVVRGRVQGSIRGKRVMLQANSHVEGDIYHKALAIEQGAFFEGKSRRAEDPLADTHKSEAPPMATPTA